MLYRLNVIPSLFAAKQISNSQEDDNEHELPQPPTAFVRKAVEDTIETSCYTSPPERARGTVVEIASSLHEGLIRSVKRVNDLAPVIEPEEDDASDSKKTGGLFA